MSVSPPADTGSSDRFPYPLALPYTCHTVSRSCPSLHRRSNWPYTEVSVTFQFVRIYPTASGNVLQTPKGKRLAYVVHGLYLLDRCQPSWPDAAPLLIMLRICVFCYVFRTTTTVAPSRFSRSLTLTLAASLSGTEGIGYQRLSPR